jgi:hypothetical protein
MQVRTYLTRNFAQICYHRDTEDTDKSRDVNQLGAGHFCQPLRVATQLGLYLHPRTVIIDTERGCSAYSL